MGDYVIAPSFYGEGVTAFIQHCAYKASKTFNRVSSGTWYFSFTMSTYKFTVLGDSNVKRHLNPVNCRDRPLMSGAQNLPCGHLALLSEAIRSVQKESNVVLLSCLTNFLTSSEAAGSSLSLRIDPVLQEVIQIIFNVAQESAERFFIIAPPMYRLLPLWYRDGLPEILSRTSEAFKSRPKNVLMMSSFSTPEFESDGIHLTAYSGMEFVLHLFDSSVKLLESLSLSSSEVSEAGTEDTRLLQDRMMAIEQDHRCLSKFVDIKSAEDSELADFHENVRLENSFMITGLKALGKMSPKEWQEQAIKDVQVVLRELLGQERPIHFIQNKTNQGKDQIVRYMVEMRRLEDSKEIRNTFGVFFVGGDKRPPALKHISISMNVTPATSVRIAVLKVLGKRYLDSNPGSKVQVISYEARPILKLHPPQPSTDAADHSEQPRRVQTFNYIQAVSSLPTNFTDDEVSLIAKKVSAKLFGTLRSTFIVITDDMIKKRSKSKSGGGGSSSTGSATGSGGSGKTGGGGKGLKRGNSSPAAVASEKQKK